LAGFLLINPRSGSGSPDADELRRAAEQKGVRVHVLGKEDDPAELARGADADALGIAGGDGSLAPVAEVAIERGLPFVCVPFGTRNHFARDAGLDPDDPVGALAAFDGIERRIDVGRVGDRVFLNNVSLGVYAHLVHRREHGRRRREALARLRALGLALRRPRPVRARVDEAWRSPAVLLVANNAYRLDPFSVGERERLDEGALHVYLTEHVLPLRWEELRAARFELEVEPSPAEAAIDGEPAELPSPIELRVEPLALRLLEPGR
jgi:diacylglycerol kinase family enzyme